MPALRAAEAAQYGIHSLKVLLFREDALGAPRMAIQGITTATLRSIDFGQDTGHWNIADRGSQAR